MKEKGAGKTGVKNPPSKSLIFVLLQHDIIKYTDFNGVIISPIDEQFHTLDVGLHQTGTNIH